MLIVDIDLPHTKYMKKISQVTELLCRQREGQKVTEAEIRIACKIGLLIMIVGFVMVIAA